MIMVHINAASMCDGWMDGRPDGCHCLSDGRYVASFGQTSAKIFNRFLVRFFSFDFRPHVGTKFVIMRQFFDSDEVCYLDLIRRTEVHLS